MSHRNDRALHVSALARVEGEGALHVRIDGATVTDVQLRIYEPPRFFEAFLAGRGHTEPPDITARICGICPVAYQMSACAAIEDACGVDVGAAIGELRRLLYCGEWIASHALHVYLLHAPDFLGYPGVVEMARDHRTAVDRGLALKQAGNAILELVGGRAIHPVNVRVGGFHRPPEPAALQALARDTLRPALEHAVATVEWVAGFDFPDFTIGHTLLALTDPHRYPIDRGEPRTSTGLAFPVRDFETHIVETQTPHSTALQAALTGAGRHLTGPLARYALNHAALSPVARAAAGAAGLHGRCDNPFRSIVVRAVELVYAVDEALRIIDAYEPPAPGHVPVPARAASGYGATEAPRGVLFHRYELDPDGTIRTARIVPPTSQNQPAIEDDLRRLVQDRLDLDDARLTAACEQAIRNYDPCISCATHFLDLTVQRR
ncbi:Ni/Fe hydrogenase subunit alpha [Dactylosporangium cerinum]|uniref:Ni/Fe hydrogenase subunit alpha n=1 Tax=Dactylosporangium cerinum TaxID=1434730 RepID=A0ABV9W4Q6_9ACTN